ncbi:Putative AC transposase OS=Zea mays PE=2 SV=2 [Sparassis crispa]|uniref:Putative AC transposase n=1 Tax=Sparassis crispa TaxID=139825 RepID=A0A401GUC1_9APHY|nr:Putative AC transposase OS=Zea mays PE=2 SV=2 [Sparassis crispa]GBE85812.1 Putative AC transposase OS=Zea mays PE=2 SV=2 [Sparassis crispa]
MKVPSPSTVSRDVQTIYQVGSKSVKEYFTTLKGAVHLVIDGWTAPFVASYLGIVIVWFDGVKLWRSILEFIRLTERHTGLYLAQMVAQCVKRFGLDKKVHTLCMDNASNCDATAVELEPLVESFRAKAFISFFFRQPKKKKVVKVAAGRKRKRSQGDMQNRPEEFELSPGEAVADGEQLMDGNHEDDDMSAVDDGKAAHDDAAVKSVHAQAVNIAREEFGIEMTPKEESEALGLFAKVAGLARRLHDSLTLQEKFEKLVDAQPELSGTKKALDRRMVTRWNSDFACLAAHIYFEIPVKQLTSDDRNDLQPYALSHAQWRLAKQLEPVLEILRALLMIELFKLVNGTQI